MYVEQQRIQKMARYKQLMTTKKAIPARHSNRQRVQREMYLPPLTSPPKSKECMMEKRNKKKKLTYNKDHTAKILATGTQKAKQRTKAKKVATKQLETTKLYRAIHTKLGEKALLIHKIAKAKARNPGTDD
jgi:hypothetical protein